MSSQVVISRIQNRRGLRENLPQPLKPGEFALTSDTKQVWVGGDPSHTVSGIAVYSDKDISTAQTILDTILIEARFDDTFNNVSFNTLVNALTSSGTITIATDQIGWDTSLKLNPPNTFSGYAAYIVADQSVDPANTLANVINAINGTPLSSIFLTADYLGNLPPFGGNIDSSGFLILDNHTQAKVISQLINSVYSTSPSINESPTGLVHTSLNIEIGTRIVGEDVGGGGVVTNTNIAETFLGDGLTSTFVLQTPDVSTLQPYVSINGLTQVPVTHYNIAGFDITFDEAPPNNAEILVMIPRSFLI